MLPDSTGHASVRTSATATCCPIPCEGSSQLRANRRRPGSAYGSSGSFCPWPAPCEGCAPAATVLVAALPEMTPPGHSVALDLLARISAAEMTGPAHEQIGEVDVKEIRQAVASGFQHYVAVLRGKDSAKADICSCVDLMDILAFHMTIG